MRLQSPGVKQPPTYKRLSKPFEVHISFLKTLPSFDSFPREVMLAGAHVVLAVRDADAGLRSIDEIKETAVERGIDPASLKAEVGSTNA
jgi:hypothetical protein